MTKPQKQSKNRLQRARDFLNATPTLKRRIIVGLFGAAGSALVTWFVFQRVISDASDFPTLFVIVAAASAGGFAFSTTRVGLAIFYGFVVAIWLLIEIIGAFLAALFSGVG